MLNFLENFFGKYENIINFSMPLITLFSVVFAVITYRCNVRRENKRKYEQSNVLKNRINRETREIKFELNRICLEISSIELGKLERSKEKNSDLFFYIINEFKVKNIVDELRSATEKLFSEQATLFTKKDIKLIESRIAELDNLYITINLYIDSRNEQSNDKPLSKSYEYELEKDIKNFIFEVIQDI